MNAEQYKANSLQEFSKAADKYETSEAGVYKICRHDYPDIAAEVKKEQFDSLLDVGCGTAPMISLLSKEMPDCHYTGLDLTPAMIEVAKSKNIPNAVFVVGDAENLPFAESSFDVVICSQSFHHYPNPQDFFGSVARVLRPGGRLVLRDMSTSCTPLRWFFNHVEIPLLNRFGYGDVAVYGRSDIRAFAEKAGLVLEKFEYRRPFRMHCVIRKK